MCKHTKNEFDCVDKNKQCFNYEPKCRWSIGGCRSAGTREMRSEERQRHWRLDRAHAAVMRCTHSHLPPDIRLLGAQARNGLNDRDQGTKDYHEHHKNIDQESLSTGGGILHKKVDEAHFTILRTTHPSIHPSMRDELAGRRTASWPEHPRRLALPCPAQLHGTSGDTWIMAAV